MPVIKSDVERVQELIVRGDHTADIVIGRAYAQTGRVVVDRARFRRVLEAAREGVVFGQRFRLYDARFDAGAVDALKPGDLDPLP